MKTKFVPVTARIWIQISSPVPILAARGTYRHYSTNACKQKKKTTELVEAGSCRNKTIVTAFP
jgi:hypothetical protein